MEEYVSLAAEHHTHDSRKSSFLEARDGTTGNVRKMKLSESVSDSTHEGLKRDLSLSRKSN